MTSDTPRSKAREAKQALYRDLILDAAEQVFAERGYDGTKVTDIAKEAGLSLGTLYGVFGGKAEVHKALHERRLEVVLGLSDLPVPDVGSVLFVVMAGVRVYVEFHVDHPNYLRMHLREGNAWTSEETMQHDVEVRAWREGIRRMKHLFRAGQKAGDIIEGDPVLLAKMMVATHQVLLADWVEKGMEVHADDVVRQAQEATLRILATPQGLERVAQA